jgi:hypothetical protein
MHKVFHLTMHIIIHIKNLKHTTRQEEGSKGGTLSLTLGYKSGLLIDRLHLDPDTHVAKYTLESKNWPKKNIAKIGNTLHVPFSTISSPYSNSIL